MRVAIIAMLSVVLGAGAALAQSSPTAPAKAPLAKESRAARVAECMQLWDAATHMTKREWANTCERIQTRLESLKIENMDLPKSGRRKKGGA
jgi:hypothetical protein